MNITTRDESSGLFVFQSIISKSAPPSAACAYGRTLDPKTNSHEPKRGIFFAKRFPFLIFFSKFAR